ncbi:MAG: type II toxin-antitoxin system PemK/MazF family toxin [Candidatus Pacebacteria bacterium]|jgi:mRNA interferase MazF|nr:type II toxin-antitoxin system PemK/MazF family toxin [Candidatus Paceibacterota bacterium]
MYKKGTVILVPFPFTDLSGNKVRPAVIVSEKKIGSDVVVVFITSQTKQKEKHLVIIKPEEGNGLKVLSKVVCSKIATLDAKIVLGELGTVSGSVLSQIDQELRKVLGL